MKKNARYLLLLSSFLIMGLVVNSCKKDNQSPIHALFIGGYWELASVQDTVFLGNTVVSTDTLNVPCSQSFTFNTNNTCTYTNFDCITQSPSPAQWSLAADQLFLQTNIVCKDTTSVGSSMPFVNAKILNLGQFSLVLETGDFQPNYSLTAHRKVRIYGFIRQKLNGAD